MRGRWHHLWMIAALGMTAGSALLRCMTRPPASAFVTASPAFSGEPNAALIGDDPAHTRTGLTAYRTHRFDQDFDRAWRHARRAESSALPVRDLLAAPRRAPVEPP